MTHEEVPMRRIVRLSLLLTLCAPAAFAAPELRIAVTYPATLASGPLDGRLLLVPTESGATFDVILS